MRANDPPYDINDQTTAGTSSPHIPSTSTSFNNNIQASNNANPESDSFAYMETLLESLAVLGKLGSALDNIGHRLPGEIFALVEITLNEVEERAKYTQRQNAGSTGSVPGGAGGVGKSDSVYLFASGTGGKPIPLTPAIAGKSGKGKGPSVKSSMLRLAALESSAKHMDHEVLKDLFWTLYSKLDAVAQGLRVISEVANRIGSVSDIFDKVCLRVHCAGCRGGISRTRRVRNPDRSFR